MNQPNSHGLAMDLLSRSLAPKDWDTEHEVAWNWLWENVERVLKAPACVVFFLGDILLHGSRG